MKKYKFLLSSAIIATSFASSLAVISCGDEQVAAKDTLVINYQGNIPFSPLFLDNSMESQSSVKSDDILATISSAKLFRNQTISSPIIDPNKNGEVVKKGTYKFALDLAESITVYDAEENSNTFNNDNVSESTFSSDFIYEQLSSEDPESINSSFFKEKMQQAVKIEIKVRDNVYWSDNKGTKTKYKVVPEDFWFSWMRSYHIGHTNRENSYLDLFNNDVENLDEKQKQSKKAELAKKLSSFLDQKAMSRIGVNDRFNDQLFTNENLFTSNKVSVKLFRETNEDLNPLNAIKDGKLVFQTDEEASKNNGDFLTFWNLVLKDSNLFSAAPSQYIQESSQKPKFNETIDYQYSLEKNGEIKTLKAPIYGDKMVKKLGLYFYGVNGFEENLYASAYVPYQGSSKTNSLSFKKNPNYWDTKFVNSQKSLQTIKLNANVSDKSQKLNNFLNGENSILSSNDYSQNDLHKLNLSDLSKYNITYIQNINKNKSEGLTGTNITPAPNIITKDEVYSKDYENHAFNNVYAKLVYNATIDDIKRGFKKQTDVQTGYVFGSKSISSGLFETRSVSFRSLLNGAINWKWVAEKVNSDNSSQIIPWLTNAAPDALIGGNNQETSKVKSPRDAHETINTLKVILADGTVETLENNNNTKSYESANFELIKAEMEKLLDNFYNSLSADQRGQKVKWYIYNSRIINEKEREIYNQIINTIKSIDPRLEPVFVQLTTSEEITKALGEENGAGYNSIDQKIVYSYESGQSQYSFLDKITHGIGMSPFALWYKFSILNENDSLAVEFPGLYAFSKAMKEDFEAKKYRLAKIYDPSVEGNYRDIQWTDLDKFNSFEEMQLYRNSVYDAKLNGWTYTNKNGPAGIGYLIVDNKWLVHNINTSKEFAIRFLKSHTNETVVQLLQDLNIWRSFGIDIFKFIKTSSYLITHKDLDLVIPLDNVIYVQDYKVKSQK